MPPFIPTAFAEAFSVRLSVALEVRRALNRMVQQRRMFLNWASSEANVICGCNHLASLLPTAIFPDVMPEVPQRFISVAV